MATRRAVCQGLGATAVAGVAWDRTPPLAVAQMASPASGPGVGFSSLYAKTDGTLAYKTGTSASGGTAATLPTAPVGYLSIMVSGTERKLAYY